jgi:hypothetical protein
MKHKLLAALGVIVFGCALFAASPAAAASAAGPYYATPSWDQTLPAATRFIVLTNMNGQGVLDRETGLIWAQSPPINAMVWQDAMDYCTPLLLGGRMGWRLPTIAELDSLHDPTQSDQLPSGHPFSNVKAFGYWSSSTYSGDSGSAWLGMIAFFPTSHYAKSSSYYVWPVRGGGGQ